MSDAVNLTNSIMIARRLAAGHSSSSLPCPVCLATLNATNLDKHLNKVHAAEMQLVSSEAAAGPLHIRGRDGRIFVPSAVVMSLWAVAAFAVIIVSGGQLSSLYGTVLGGTGLASLVFFGAASAGLFKATLQLDGNEVRLRWFLGLASVCVPLPATLESGTFTKQVRSSITHATTNPTTETVRGGAYLRLYRKDVSIRIGAAKASKLGRNWAQEGWSQAKQKGRPDIVIDRTQLLAIEYELASRGQLTPKTA